MPVGDTVPGEEGFLFIEDVLRTMASLGPVRSLGIGPLDGPARRYILAGARGEIGVIGALSSPFCRTCNRLRLTADGHLRGCLFSDRQTDIKTPLRQGKDDAHLKGLIARAIWNKPASHGLAAGNFPNGIHAMNCIGG
jgi:cyclic pyranopterin phosphate synthase